MYFGITNDHNIRMSVVLENPGKAFTDSPPFAFKPLQKITGIEHQQTRKTTGRIVSLRCLKNCSNIAMPYLGMTFDT